MNADLLRCCEFLQQIGLAIREVETANGFIPHVLIVDGELHFTKAARPSNLLHEAGHVAVFPARYRSLINYDTDEAACLMFEDLDNRAKHEDPAQFEPDAPLIRAAIQAGEPEATAWAFAAGRAIGLSDERIIEDTDYEDGGAEVRLALSFNAYLGINGLVRAGMCQSVRAFPTLTRWLQV